MLYGWTPGIGDPTVWGWLTVANYAFSAFLLWQVVHLLRWQRAFDHRALCRRQAERERAGCGKGSLIRTVAPIKAPGFWRVVGSSRSNG